MTSNKLIQPPVQHYLYQNKNKKMWSNTK